MAAFRVLLPCLLVAALASGCISDLAASANVPGDPGAAAPPQGTQAGSAATHGSPRRADGTVETGAEGSQFVARRTVTIDNDFGGAARSSLLLTSFNGGIAVGVSTDGGYHLTAELYGRGQSQDDARQALDLLRLQNGDELRGGALDLSFVLTSGAPSGIPVPIGLPRSFNNGATFRLTVPAEPAHDLEAGTSNGGVDAMGLHGPRLKAGSSNGGIDVVGAFDRVEAGTSNAGIDLSGVFGDVKAQTSNGGISAELESSRTSTVDLSTSNARIDVQVPRDGSAFDIAGDTSNGEVRFDLEGRESEDDDHDTFRSSDWSSADVKVTMALDTSNASIDVQD